MPGRATARSRRSYLQTRGAVPRPHRRSRAPPASAISTVFARWWMVPAFSPRQGPRQTLPFSPRHSPRQALPFGPRQGTRQALPFSPRHSPRQALPFGPRQSTRQALPFSPRPSPRQALSALGPRQSPRQALPAFSPREGLGGGVVSDNATKGLPRLSAAVQTLRNERKVHCRSNYPRQLWRAEMKRWMTNCGKDVEPELNKHDQQDAVGLI